MSETKRWVCAIALGVVGLALLEPTGNVFQTIGGAWLIGIAHGVLRDSPTGDSET